MQPTSDSFPAILHGLEGHASGASCRVRPDGEGLEILVDDAHAGKLPYAGMEIAVTGMDGLYLSFSSSAEESTIKLLVKDRAIAAQMTALGAPRGVLDQLERIVSSQRRKRAGGTGLLVGLGLVIVAVVVAAYIGFGWAVNKVVGVIPAEWERGIGQVAAQDILNENQICVDPELNRAVIEIGTRLVGGLPASPYGFKIRVVDSDEVNAFALPGGYIFLNRGLIERSDGADEVAGVLAHEIQHVLYRHGLHNLVRQAGMMIIVMAVFGDAGGLERYLMYQAAGLASMSFSREQERVADTAGVALMQRAAFDPSGLIRFLKKIEAEEGIGGALPTMFSTHPGTDERQEELGALIGAGDPAGVRPLTVDWASIKGRCTPETVADPDAT